MKGRQGEEERRRQENGERFSSPLPHFSASHLLAWPNLTDAWERVADNRGAPGADRVSIARYARNWEANLRTLAERVESGSYRPARLRRIAIPKKSGGQRLLTIPTVADRVLQRALLNLVDDRWERQFLACSHGYRPGRGVRTALAEVLRFRNYGMIWVAEADIDDCFHSLDHQLLRSFLAQEIEDPPTLALLDAWLAQGKAEADPDRGIALGMPISPLLCNIYLHRLDQALVRGRWAVVRYADDFVICCHTRQQAERALAVTGEILAGLKLRLEPTKSRVSSYDEGFDFLGIHFEGDSYSFHWQQKRFVVEGPVPGWLWGYVPEGYE